MSAIRVLRVIGDLQVGGVQRMMLRSLRGLRNGGVESEVCCQKTKGPLAGEFEAEGFRVHLVSFPSRLSPAALYQLRRLATQGDFQIVHAHQYQSNMAANLACLRCRGVRVINSYHSFLPVQSRTQALQLRLTRHIPAAYIAVSEAVRQPLIEQGIPPAKIHVIHNGVPVPEMAAPLPERGEDAPLELIYAGRFVKQKRLDFLIAVMKRCVEKGVPARLTMLGEGPTWERVQRLVREAGIEKAVALPGVTHDVASWLERSDLYVSTSEREGFANALLECCAAGRGFLASDIPPHREMLGDSGGGILLNDSIDGWVEAIATLAGNRAELARLGAAAFARVQAFSEKAANQKLLDLYRRILAD